MNKAIHGLIALFFGIGCGCLWGMLTLTLNTTQRWMAGGHVPAFTKFWLSLRPLFVILPILALGWCIYAWFRKTQSEKQWVGFFATSTGVLVLVMLPTIIATWLPLISMIEKIGRAH